MVEKSKELENPSSTLSIKGYIFFPGRFSQGNKEQQANWRLWVYNMTGGVRAELSGILRFVDASSKGLKVRREWERALGAGWVF